MRALRVSGRVTEHEGGEACDGNGSKGQRVAQPLPQRDQERLASVCVCE